LRLRHGLKVWARNCFFLAVDISPNHFIGFYHSIHGGIDIGKGILILGSVISEVVQSSPHFNRANGAATCAGDDQADSVRETKRVDVNRIRENKRVQCRDCLLKLRLPHSNFALLLLQFLNLAEGYKQGIFEWFIAHSEDILSEV